jgi:hypothetical protein
MATDPTSADTGKTIVERLAHYREQAAQFYQWAADETGLETRAGLLDMARQYERLASELEARIGLRQSEGERPSP